MVLLKTIVIMITAWIGTMWPYSWTSLIMTLSLAVMCLSLAYEQRSRGAGGAKMKPATT